MPHATAVMPSKKPPAVPPATKPARSGRKKILSENAVPTSVRLEPETIEALRDAASDMREPGGKRATMTELMRSIIESWVEETTPPPRRPGKQ